jgi:hypothetical protein
MSFLAEAVSDSRSIIKSQILISRWHESDWRIFMIDLGVSIVSETLLRKHSPDYLDSRRVS